MDGVGDFVFVGAGETLDVFLLGLLLVLRIGLRVAAGQRFESVGPGEVCGVEDVEAAVATGGVGVRIVTADDDDLAIVEVTCMAYAWVRGVRSVDGDPLKGWDGQDEHVAVLGLVFVGDEVLAAVHVDIRRGAVGSGGDDSAGVDA